MKSTSTTRTVKLDLTSYADCLIFEIVHNMHNGWADEELEKLIYEDIGDYSLIGSAKQLHEDAQFMTTLKKGINTLSKIPPPNSGTYLFSLLQNKATASITKLVGRYMKNTGQIVLESPYGEDLFEKNKGWKKTLIEQKEFAIIGWEFTPRHYHQNEENT